MGDVTPKLPSTASLFQTLLVLPMAGNAPVLVAGPPTPFGPSQTAVVGQSGGICSPMVRVVAVPVYTLRETTRLPVVKPVNESPKTGAARMTPQTNRVSFRWVVFMC